MATRKAGAKKSSKTRGQGMKSLEPKRIGALRGGRRRTDWTVGHVTEFKPPAAD